MPLALTKGKCHHANTVKIRWRAIVWFWFREFFTRLKRHAFDGWISIEEASFTGREAIREAAILVRELWSQI